jgi:uncharacterized membrane-anchored protein
MLETPTVAGRSLPGTLLSKVPEVTVFFWVIKILATTVGETGADWLGTHLDLSLTGVTLIMTALLAVALVLQFRARGYVPAIYWVSVVLISVVGTLITDNLTDHFGISLEVTTGVFAVAMLATFALWFASERTLSIHSIRTVKREAFYWTAILFTFALGTAAGDLVAEKADLGYGLSVLLFGALLAIVAVATLRFGLGAVLGFWMAYVLTRPLGASLGDFLSQARDDGGRGLGTVGTSAIFLVTILAVVVYLTRTKRDQVTSGD